MINPNNSSVYAIWFNGDEHVPPGILRVGPRAQTAVATDPADLKRFIETSTGAISGEADDFTIVELVPYKEGQDATEPVTVIQSIESVDDLEEDVEYYTTAGAGPYTVIGVDAFDHVAAKDESDRLHLIHLKNLVVKKQEVLQYVNIAVNGWTANICFGEIHSDEATARAAARETEKSIGLPIQTVPIKTWQQQ